MHTVTKKKKKPPQPNPKVILCKIFFFDFFGELGIVYNTLKVN